MLDPFCHFVISSVLSTMPKTRSSRGWQSSRRGSSSSRGGREQPRPSTRRSSSQSGNSAPPETQQDTQLDLSSLTMDALVGLTQSQISHLDQSRTESSQAPPLPGTPSPGTSTVSSESSYSAGQGPSIGKLFCRVCVDLFCVYSQWPDITSGALMHVLSLLILFP